MPTDALWQQKSRGETVFVALEQIHALRFLQFGGISIRARGGFPMASRTRKLKIVAAAAAIGLLWTQAASAAAPQLSAPVDPLVALSALGTTGSNSAVCAGAQASTSAAAAAATAGPAAGPCVLPVTDAAPPPVGQPAAAVPPPLEQTAAPAFNLLPLLAALGAVVVVGAILLSGGGHGSGNLSPVSPA
jgi:hypothetical protein